MGNKLAKTPVFGSFTLVAQKIQNLETQTNTRATFPARGCHRHFLLVLMLRLPRFLVWLRVRDQKETVTPTSSKFQIHLLSNACWESSYVRNEFSTCGQIMEPCRLIFKNKILLLVKRFRSYYEYNSIWGIRCLLYPEGNCKPCISGAI